MDYGGMVGNIKTVAVTVGTSPTKISPRTSGAHTLEICNVSSGDVFLGGSEVKTGTGIPITGKTSKAIPVNGYAAGNLYLISAAETKVIVAEYTP